MKWYSVCMVANSNQIQLPADKTASIILYEAISAALLAFPVEFASMVEPTSAKAFKEAYIHFLPEFEAARLASAKSIEIARCLVKQMQQSVVWQGAEGDVPLSEYLETVAEPMPLIRYHGRSGLISRPDFVYEDQTWSDLTAVGERLFDRNVITQPASDALTWLQQNLTDLRGRRVAVLGAAAEMASTELFLKMGADVLWLDKTPPPESWSKENEFAGTLHFPRQNADLLSQPREILATLHAFSNGQPLDLCLYAYAPGQAREIRLTAAMNALVDVMPKQQIASITMLVSPTTPVSLSKAELQRISERRSSRPSWEAALDTLGIFGNRGGIVEMCGAASARSLVSIQGTSYQAAQYLGKVVTAVVWAEQGHRVSANTAAITKTRSLDHPVFAAAFGGAAALGVETFSVSQSTCLSGLLSMHDWLRAERPTPGAVRIHGGIHTLPYPLEFALRPAAAIGFLKRPQLFLGFFR